MNGTDVLDVETEIRRNFTRRRKFRPNPVSFYNANTFSTLDGVEFFLSLSNKHAHDTHDTFPTSICIASSSLDNIRLTDCNNCKHTPYFSNYLLPILAQESNVGVSFLSYI